MRPLAASSNNKELIMVIKRAEPQVAAPAAPATPAPVPQDPASKARSSELLRYLLPVAAGGAAGYLLSDQDDDKLSSSVTGALLGGGLGYLFPHGLEKEKKEPEKEPFVESLFTPGARNVIGTGIAGGAGTLAGIAGAKLAKRGPSGLAGVLGGLGAGVLANQYIGGEKNSSVREERNMSGINSTLLMLAQAGLSGQTKRAFVPAPPAGGAMPPMDPSMMAGGAMPPAPPMDPSMLPAAMGMSPADSMAAAGMPMDPSMAMAGGAPVDPTTGAVAGAAPAGGEAAPIDPALQAAIDEAVAKATGGQGNGQSGGESKPKTGGKVSPEAFTALQSDVAEMKGMLHKAIGYLMGAGKIPAEGMGGDDLGAAEAEVPQAAPGVPVPEKVAFARSKADPLLDALVRILKR